MDDLIAFLRARLDEDEAAARKADREGLNGVSPDEPQTWYLSGGESIYSDPHGVGLVTGTHGYLGDELGNHIVRHQPSRVLADVDAKRQILDDHTTMHTVTDGFCFEERGPCTHAGEAWCDWHGTDGCSTVLLLALPFAGHPDYREEWAV